MRAQHSDKQISEEIRISPRQISMNSLELLNKLHPLAIMTSIYFCTFHSRLAEFLSFLVPRREESYVRHPSGFNPRDSPHPRGPAKNVICTAPPTRGKYGRAPFFKRSDGHLYSPTSTPLLPSSQSCPPPFPRDLERLQKQALLSSARAPTPRHSTNL